MPNLHCRGAAAPRPHRHTPPRAAAIGPVPVLAVLGSGLAQVFSAERYLQECLRFEAGGDYTTARQSCLNALQVDPQLVPANLALARIEMQLGDLGPAESRLNRIRNQVGTPEPTVLLAEIAYRSERYAEASGLATTARSQLAQSPNVELSARVAYLEGLIASREGRIDDALEAFDRAVLLDGLQVRYRLADAELRFRLGDLSGALQQLREYERISGDTTNPDVASLQGRLLWAQGDVGPATDRIEQALALRSLRDSAGQAEDLRVLAILYYGQGQFEAGGIALREALRRGNLLGDLASNAMVWLLIVVALLAVHLLGESRHGDVVRAGAESGPDGHLWTLGQAYGILLGAIVAGLAASLAYSSLAYDNLLALVTPVQQQDARAVYLITFALIIALLSWNRARRSGFDPAERLVGRSSEVATGVVAGVVLLAVVIAYLAYTERSGVFGPFFLDLSRPTPLAVVALALLPLSELYFRGILFQTVAKRYDPRSAVIVAALVWAAVLVTPALLLALVGVALSELYRRRQRNGLMVVVTVLVGWVGLALAAVVSPFVRGLFFY
jgi:tetratricopeptide (TPR) repeat protein